MSIVLVNQTAKSLTFGGSTAKTMTIPAPTAGNTLFLTVGSNTAGGTGHVISVSGGGVTWVKQETSQVNNESEIWAGANSSGSGTAITITVSATYAVYNAVVGEFSGMPSTLSASGTPASNTGSSGAGSITTGTTTPTSGNAVLIIAACGTGSSTQPASPTNGFTAFTTTGITTTNSAASYRIVTSASGSYSTAWSAASSVTFDSTIAAFNGASGTSVKGAGIMTGGGLGGGALRTGGRL